MILLKELLDEDSEAAAQAKQMGLISKGWGRWADPRTGKVTHKTDGIRLVAVDPQQDKSGGEKEIGPKPTSSQLGQIAKDLKGKADRRPSLAGPDAFTMTKGGRAVPLKRNEPTSSKNDRELKIANMSGPAVEDALNKHGIGDNWGGNVSWQHDPETGDVDGWDDEGGDYGSVRAIGSGRYMVRLPGQKYEESNKVGGLKAAVNTLADANKDNY